MLPSSDPDDFINVVAPRTTVSNPCSFVITGKSSNRSKGLVQPRMGEFPLRKYRVNTSRGGLGSKVSVWSQMREYIHQLYDALTNDGEARLLRKPQPETTVISICFCFLVEVYVDLICTRLPLVSTKYVVIIVR
jgi:hypothetical protein